MGHEAKGNISRSAKTQNYFDQSCRGKDQTDDLVSP